MTVEVQELDRAFVCDIADTDLDSPMLPESLYMPGVTSQRRDAG